MLVGAGGAGRAMAFGAKSRGARVVIFNRNYGNSIIQPKTMRRFSFAFIDLSVCFSSAHLISQLQRESKGSCRSYIW